MVSRVAVQFTLLLVIGPGVSQGQEDADPCDSYSTLTDAWRNPEENADPIHCDVTLPAGWYRFRLDDQPAVASTQCMQDSTCGTRVSLHVAELDGGLQVTQIAVGQNVSGVLCGSYNVDNTLDCCVQRQPTSVKRCADHDFIYRLQPQSVCAAVCAHKLEETIPAKYIAKHGDRPRSLGEEKTSTVSAIAGSSTTSQQPVITRTLGADTSYDVTSTQSLPSAPTAVDSASVNVSATSNTSSNVTVDDVTSPGAATGVANGTALAGSNETSTGTDLLASSEAGSGTGSDAVTTDAQLPRSANASDVDQNVTQTSSSPAPAVTPSIATIPTSTATSNSTPVASTSTPTSSSSLSSLSPSSTTKTGSTTAAVLSPASSQSTTTGYTTLDTVVVSRSSAGFDVKTARMSSTTAPATPPAGHLDSVRFVLKGRYEETDFGDSLVSFFNDNLFTATPSNGSDYNLTTVSSHKNITTVDLVISQPDSNKTVSAKDAISVLIHNNYTQVLESQTSLSLMALCPSVSRCDYVDTAGSKDGVEEPDVFSANQAVFIPVLSVASFLLLALILGLLYVRCRRQGTWVLAPDHEEKDAEHLAVESPMTDTQIVQGEADSAADNVQMETTLTINGHNRPHTPDDIPAADEDNGWVVPLDQAPPTPTPTPSPGLAQKTEDTQF